LKEENEKVIWASLGYYHTLVVTGKNLFISQLENKQLKKKEEFGALGMVVQDNWVSEI
jgi:hypothetical protein